MKKKKSSDVAGFIAKHNFLEETFFLSERSNLWKKEWTGESSLRQRLLQV